MKNDTNANTKPSGFAKTGPVGLILSSDEGAAGKTTTALQLVTAFELAGQPLDLFQMDTKRKLAMKSGIRCKACSFRSAVRAAGTTWCPVPSSGPGTAQ
ncbi:hypothetical protein [Bradyrhizobium sp.]|uniref:hypothetical protein n=1 Tax=Bradyrhizobium sp. TaxID=376 RepID=UPI001EC3E722|nr:hypothetical protein [Bradyrhizobium sp.]MBV9978451.1 hypothetical protein [Bradyrhizobium sp.]